MKSYLSLAAIVATAGISAAAAQDSAGLAVSVMKGAPYSPYADRALPENVYFGDTHVHTGLSADAGGDGTILMPRYSYRFARGEHVTSNTGLPVKLHQSFNFYMITDHSDGMRLITDLKNGAPNVMADPMGKDLNARLL